MTTFLNTLWTILREDFTRQIGRRRDRSHIGQSDPLEQRLLLTTSFDGHWDLVFDNPGDTPNGDPGPYSLDINVSANLKSVHTAKSSQFGFIHIPGEGGAAFKSLKIKGDTLKGKIRSGDLKANVKAIGTIRDPDNDDNPWHQIKVDIQVLSPLLTMGPLSGSR